MYIPQYLIDTKFDTSYGELVNSINEAADDSLEYLEELELAWCQWYDHYETILDEVWSKARKQQFKQGDM